MVNSDTGRHHRLHAADGASCARAGEGALPEEGGRIAGAAEE